MARQTLIDLLYESVERYQDRVHMRERHPDGWVDLSFKTLAAEAEASRAAPREVPREAGKEPT